MVVKEERQIMYRSCLNCVTNCTYDYVNWTFSFSGQYSFSFSHQTSQISDCENTSLVKLSHWTLAKTCNLNMVELLLYTGSSQNRPALPSHNCSCHNEPIFAVFIFLFTEPRWRPCWMWFTERIDTKLHEILLQLPNWDFTDSESYLL